MILGLPWLRIQTAVLRNSVVWTLSGISPQFRELFRLGRARPTRLRVGGSTSTGVYRLILVHVLSRSSSGA